MVFHLPLNVMEDAIKDLESEQELMNMFGVPVSRKLVVATAEDDIRIELAPGVELNIAQTKLFMTILSTTLTEHRMRYYGEDE